MTLHKLLLFALALTLGAGASTGQKHTDGSASSSVTYFSESKTVADGGLANSATYALTATIGQPAPGDVGSTTYALTGGFVGTLDATSSEPWLTAANPAYVMPRSNDLLWLSGARLNLGLPSVVVSGRPVTVVASSATDVAIRLPALPDPGWHSITLSNTAGTTTIERGVGVLPLMYTDGAPASEVEFDIVFRGTKGDVVVWAMGVNPGTKLPIGPYLYGLTIDASFVRILPAMLITANSGEVRFSVPAVPITITFYLQGLFLTNNPGYAPGSFSNLLKL